MMYPIKKIVITGDVLRIAKNGHSSQNINIRWLYYLIYPALTMLSNIKIVPLLHTEAPDNLTDALYGAMHLPSSFEGWIKIYEKTPSPASLALIHQRMEDSLVIAFEMPDFIRAALDKMAIPYLDFTIHPARFMDDLAFGVRSNIVGVCDLLRSNVVVEEEIRLSAGLAAAMLSRLPPIGACSKTQNAALFCAQTTDDKVLIRNGHLLTATDFIDDFSEIANRHDKVFVKPHPYAKDNPITLALTRLFSNTEIIEENFYRLITQDVISNIYSITSSTSIEAAYFGKQGIHLSRYPYIFSDKSALNGNYLSIKPIIHTLNLWRNILSHLGIAVKSVRNVELPNISSRMRRSLKNYWGAEIFENP